MLKLMNLAKRSGILANVPTGLIKRTYCAKQPNDMLVFRQLFDHNTFTFTYILADPVTRDAVIIDPVYEQAERDLALINQIDLNLKYAINTHVHADHVTGSGRIKFMNKAVKSVISEYSKANADVHVKDGEKIKFGNEYLECISTPGHTNGCMSFISRSANIVFTGDALLIRGCGRTDFQQGNSNTLYESIHKKIFTLPDNFIVFPGHDYTGQTASSVGEEKRYNPRLIQNKEVFARIMSSLNLPYPKQMDRAVPANMICGLQDPQNHKDSH